MVGKRPHLWMMRGIVVAEDQMASKSASLHRERFKALRDVLTNAIYAPFRRLRKTARPQDG
jgi:hypothetical protein